MIVAGPMRGGGQPRQILGAHDFRGRCISQARGLDPESDLFIFLVEPYQRGPPKVSSGAQIRETTFFVLVEQQQRDPNIHASPGARIISRRPWIVEH